MHVHYFGLTNAPFQYLHRHRGVVAYLGEVHYAKGLYAGVVMNDPMQGKNNGISQIACVATSYFPLINTAVLTGIIKGKEYFHCGAKEKGLMVPIGDIKHI